MIIKALDRLCKTYLFQIKNLPSLRVNVRTIQSDAEQGSLDLADFHIYCSVFHADSHGAIRFS